MITIHIIPAGETREIQKPNTVLQLLNRLGLRRTDALIIRGDEMLTQDRTIDNEDHITIRMVGSRG
ncbi:sulfur carrier protein [Desulfobaculum xiamenense]|uniref:Sulfur carrier protein n=1 Tax=Desulfobaculum xiamenense TaxID=995050 RepID=A0A846QHJ3_9BACT|nr:hypothetical protein [Desulfobaculum xiamenense]NJB67738.1 sulfur carrier protein [Desulfobaculum xiamenense]